MIAARLRLPSALALALSIAAAALVVAGCGDDQSSSDQQLSKDEFISQADEICAAADKRLTDAAQEKFGTEGVPPPKDEQVAFFKDVVAPELQSQHDEIADLNPPAEDAEQVDAVLAALQELADKAKDDPEALLEAQGSEAARLAGEYGFEVCGG